ncbi:peptidase [candidate division KSB1 bacterium]|nr:ATP-dependent zinc protease [candidate division KSB1 bacterium]RQW01984.1 MAG: peptidase [candidate division KSB1 bacterium]
MTKKRKIIIGRSDKADFPELYLFDIDVKIDTGAYSSAIHCHNIKIIGDAGQRKVHFNLLDPSHSEYNEKEYILPVHKTKRVKNSSGESSERIFIKTKIMIYGRSIPVELSLTDRSEMKFPVLLGRKLLKKRFVVDVSKKNLSFNQKYDQPT